MPPHGEVDHPLNIELNTFHGPNDWATSADQAIVNTALRNPSAFGEQPFNLEPPAINNCNLVILASNKKNLHMLAMEAAWESILPKIFEQTCPGIDNDPVKIITSLCQVSMDAKGNNIVLSIQQFNNNMLNVTNFLSNSADAVWPVDITQHFVTHLLNDITKQILCPKSLIPHAPIHGSDQNFGKISKKSVTQTYKLIGLEGYLPATPWVVPTALSIAQLAIARQ